MGRESCKYYKYICYEVNSDKTQSLRNCDGGELEYEYGQAAEGLKKGY
jgi:hypothetical protein